MKKTFSKIFPCGQAAGLNYFLPARPVFYEKPSGSRESEPPAPKLPGVPIEDVNLMECPEYKHVKYTLTEDEAETFKKVQAESARVIQEMKRQGMLEKLTLKQVQNTVRMGLMTYVKIPPVLNKALAEKMQGPEHVYSLDTGRHYVEVNIAADKKPFVDIIKKDAVPDNLYGLKKNVGTLLAFRTKATAELEKLGTRKEIRKAGQALIDATPGLQDMMTVENSPERSIHLFSKRLNDRELISVRLYRDTEHENKLYLLILPFKKAPKPETANK